MSMEALAMAGGDYREEFEIKHEGFDGSFEQPQAQQIDQGSSDAEVANIHTADLSLEAGKEWIKIKIREWAKVVASNNDKEAYQRLREIALLMDNHIMPAK